MEEKARIIQELVPGKQVTIAHLIAHPDEDLAKKMGVPGAEAVGILTLSPREAAMIAGDFATKPLPSRSDLWIASPAHWSFRAP